MATTRVKGDGFTHLVIQRAGTLPNSRLHIYIEGDGTPWVGNFPSEDPTPHNALALRLANKDSSDIAYVGRPCYFGLANEKECQPKFWTSHRYGDDVVASMASVIKRVRQSRHTEIVLIGHSGGGVLAALLETRVVGVVGVITVGANLDIDRWTQHHNYDPLTGSINPLMQERDPNIPHLQLIGKADNVVPTSISTQYSALHTNVELMEFDGFDHVCCWEKQWPTILSAFSNRLNECQNRIPVDRLRSSYLGVARPKPE